MGMWDLIRHAILMLRQILEPHCGPGPNNSPTGPTEPPSARRGRTNERGRPRRPLHSLPLVATPENRRISNNLHPSNQNTVPTSQLLRPTWADEIATLRVHISISRVTPPTARRLSVAARSPETTNQQLQEITRPVPPPGVVYPSHLPANGRKRHSQSHAGSVRRTEEFLCF